MQMLIIRRLLRFWLLAFVMRELTNLTYKKGENNFFVCCWLLNKIQAAVRESLMRKRQQVLEGNSAFSVVNILQLLKRGSAVVSRTNL